MRTLIARVLVVALLPLTSSHTSLAQGQNIFFVPPVFPGVGQTVTADFNGDGKLDLISTDGTELLGNGDGKPDLVVASSSTNTFSVLLGNGDGTFQAPKVTAVASPVSFLTVADLNGDGKSDVVVVPSLSGGGVCIPWKRGRNIFSWH